MTNLEQIEKVVEYYEKWADSAIKEKNTKLASDCLSTLQILEEMKQSKKETPCRFIMWLFGQGRITDLQADTLMGWF